MIEITFLGTGCMQPTKLRNHAGVLLQTGKEHILFDCGEGIQRQMRLAGVKPAKITFLCISHFHGDHVFGIPGLLSSMGADQFASKLHIYGPKGTKKYLDNFLKAFAVKDIVEHEVHEAASGIIIDKENFTIEAQPLKHSVPCLGYRFQEKDKRRIQVAKVQKLGLSGPILGELQRGNDVIWNGRKIKAEEVTTITPGKKISYVTDTALCNGVSALAKNADVLIMEGTLLDNLRENARKSMHLTVKQAALIASENNVQKLIITHISQRYKTNNEIMEEAQAYFRDVIIAEDFLKVKI